MERYADACVTEFAAVAGAASPAPPASSSEAAPRRAWPPPPSAGFSTPYPAPPSAEVTVECNPEDADDAHLGAYRAAGVTRVSFGLQSTNAHVLAGLGRRHVPDAAARLAAAVRRAGFDTWNLDLIFGGAGETDDDWRRTLATVLALPNPPPHISAYALTVEPGTPLAARGRPPPRRRHVWPAATS